MKDNNKLLDKLAPVAFIVAGAAWLAAIILAGFLTRSISIALVASAACALYVFGFNKFLSTTYSFSSGHNPLHFLCWFMMGLGVLIAVWLFISRSIWWVAAFLLLLQIPPFIIYFQSKADEKRIMASIDNQKPTRAQQVADASRATNIYDYADALGLNVISDRGNKGKPMHISQFAGDLPCQHCSIRQKAREWPANGDIVPFYYQKDPGNFSLKLTCPNCGKDWYVVWDQNPGPIMPLL